MLAGYQADTTGYAGCKQCHPTCKTCNGVNHLDCKSCYPGHFLYVKECIPEIYPGVEGCHDGEYFNWVTRTCDACDADCKTCEEQADKCLTCHAPKKLSPTMNLCLDMATEGCWLGEENHPSDTEKCIFRKRDCVAFDSAGECIECKKSFILDVNKNCKAYVYGLFYSPSFPAVAMPCHPSCTVGCNGPLASDCTTCDKYLQNSVCTGRCSSGYYYDHVTRLCSLCHTSCSRCNGPSDSDCTLCSGKSVYRNGKCMSLCPPGTFGNLIDGDC